MPDTTRPVPRYDFINSWPSKNTGASALADCTITVNGAPLGTARAMTLLRGSGTAGMAAHEVTHTLQQGGTGKPGTGEEITLVYTEIEWTYAEKGLPPAQMLKAKTGQIVQVRSAGRVVAEGRLKGMTARAAGARGTPTPWIILESLR